MKLQILSNSENLTSSGRIIVASDGNLKLKFITYASKTQWHGWPIEGIVHLNGRFLSSLFCTNSTAVFKIDTTFPLFESTRIHVKKHFYTVEFSSDSLELTERLKK